jgi:hypothetical protein
VVRTKSPEGEAKMQLPDPLDVAASEETTIWLKWRYVLLARSPDSRSRHANGTRSLLMPLMPSMYRGKRTDVARTIPLPST